MLVGAVERGLRVIVFASLGLQLPGCAGEPEARPDTGYVCPQEVETVPDAWDGEEPCEDEREGYFTGRFERSDGEFTSASFTYGLFDPCSAEWVCEIQGSSEVGPATEPCPDCEWHFATTPVTASVLSGPGCADLGWSDGDLDGYLEYDWGFLPTDSYYYRGWTLYEDAVLLHSVYDDWYRVAANRLPSEEGLPVQCAENMVTNEEDHVEFTTWGAYVSFSFWQAHHR